MSFLKYPAFLLIIFIFFNGCSSSTKIPKKNYRIIPPEIEAPTIKVLLDEFSGSTVIMTEQDIFLLNDQSEAEALIKTGNEFELIARGGSLSLIINDVQFSSEYFSVFPADKNNISKIMEKDYRGIISFNADGKNVQIINTLSLDDYLKGVIASEMPLGKGDENLEALKAFAISARTYAYMKKDRHKTFDVYPDVRDQVYSGVSREHSYSNKIIEETGGLILTINDQPAEIFYHSTCGGFTESSENIFGKAFPHLTAHEDGVEPFCSVSPRFNWKEIFSQKEFIQKLKSANLIPHKNLTLSGVEVLERFDSGRIKNLQIDLMDEIGKKFNVELRGNNIRYILRTNKNHILNSCNFIIRMDENKNVLIDGTGYGHGVGMCQWGAITQSRNGKNYKEIIQFYFPGTKIEKIND